MANIEKPNSDIADFVGFIQKGGKIKSFVNDIPLIELPVAGLMYIDDIESIFSKINKGDRLDLFREADNEYDDLAILVKFQGKKIGYVPRKDNTILSSLMDAGKELYGVVEEFGIEDKGGFYEYSFLSFKVFLKEEF